MVPPLRVLLVGPGDASFQRRLDVLSAVVIGALTFVAYALGAFRVSGGVIFLPGDATIVGLVAAITVGYRRGGLGFAWLTAYAPLLGFDAEWALLGLSSHTLPGKLAFLLDPVGLAVHAIAAVVFGTFGFAVGSLARYVVATVLSASERRRESH